MAEIKAVVRIKKRDMRRFFMACAYLRVKGIVSIMVSFACLVMAIVSIYLGDRTSTILFLLGASFYTIIVPIQLNLKAGVQVKAYKMDERDLFYTFSDKGLEIKSEDDEVSLPWDSVTKAIETNKQIIIYISRLQGYIVPKRYFVQTIEPLRNMIKNNIGEHDYKRYTISKEGIKVPTTIKEEKIEAYNERKKREKKEKLKEVVIDKKKDSTTETVAPIQEDKKNKSVTVDKAKNKKNKKSRKDKKNNVNETKNSEKIVLEEQKEDTEVLVEETQIISTDKTEIEQTIENETEKVVPDTQSDEETNE